MLERSKGPIYILANTMVLMELLPEYTSRWNGCLERDSKTLAKAVSSLKTILRHFSSLSPTDTAWYKIPYATSLTHTWA